MSSRLFALGFAKPDREKEEKERMKRVEKEDKAKAKLLKEAEKEKNAKERVIQEKELKQKDIDRVFKEYQLKYPKSLATELCISYSSNDEQLKGFFNIFSSIYQDIENKLHDIDIDFFIECLNSYGIGEDGKRYYHLNVNYIRNIYNIDLKIINYNKYIAYKLLKIIQLTNKFKFDGIANNLIVSEYLLCYKAYGREKVINLLKKFIKDLDAKIFMDNVNIKWNILQHAIKNNLYKMPANASPKASAKSSSPKASPKASTKSSSPKASLKTSAKSSSPKASPKSPINRNEIAGLSMEDLFAKLDTR